MIQNSFSLYRIANLNKFVLLVILSFLVNACSNNSSNSKNFYAYVTNQKGDIQVLSLDDFSIIQKIDVGLGARGLGITEDGGTLVVAVRDSNDLALIDTNNFQIIKRIPVGENPEFVRVQGNKAFVSFEPAAIGGPPPKPGSKEAVELQQKREKENEEPARVAIIDLIQKEKILSEELISKVVYEVEKKASELENN